MKKGFKHEVRYPRRYTDKMRAHLEDVRPKHGHANFKNPNGRPSKKAEVLEYKQSNPTATKYRCYKDTGLDPKTIRRWWNTEDAT